MCNSPQTQHTQAPKILLVSHGSDLVTYMTFNSLAAKHNMEVYIAAPADANLPELSHCRRITMAPIKSKWTTAARRSLRKIIKDNNMDLVHCVSTSALANTLAAAKHTGAIVTGYRGTQHRIHRFDPMNHLALLNKRVAHIVCEGADIADHLANFVPASKLSIHAKPYDAEWVKEAMANPVKLEGEGLQISYVGFTKGRPYKGLHYLIEAVNILNGRGMPCHLTVVGDADPKDMATAPTNVTFAGARTDATHFIAAADVFVLPSTRDASPRVLREAQACGVPCIVSDIPGARDLIIADGPQQTGMLVPPANAEAIADALAKFATLDTDQRQKLSINCRANIADNYQPDHYVQYFADLFNSLITKK